MQVIIFFLIFRDDVEICKYFDITKDSILEDYLLSTNIRFVKIILV